MRGAGRSPVYCEEDHMSWLATITSLIFTLLSSGGIAQELPAPARAELAPTGKLRVALLPLPHMAVRDQARRQFTGVIVDLGLELAKRLDVPAEFVPATSNVDAVDQVKTGAADVTFLVALPELSAQIDFGATYIQYETTFLVPGNSPIYTLADVDRTSVRVIAPNPSAIAAMITQTFKNVTLIGVPIATGSAQRVVEMLKNGEADAYSNLTHLLSLTQADLPDWRIVPGSYMMPVFSIGYPKNRSSGASYANTFVAEMKKSGFIQKAIERANLKGAQVPN
jgi:polar amino acid transport system substrate-binding protein